MRVEKQQKIHSAGTKEARYFYNVNVKGVGKYEYRSRHATASLVRSQFKKSGLTVIAVTPLKQ